MLTKQLASACLISIAVVTAIAPFAIVAQQIPSEPAATHPAQDSPEPANPRLTNSQDEVARLAERIAHLEERLNLALALKDERIESINDRAENVYKLFQIVGVVAGAVLLLLSIRDLIFRRREGQRQRSIDEIVKDTMSSQRTFAQQQIKFGEIQLAGAEKNLQEQMGSVEKVNKVIEVVSQTLAFRLEQESKVAEAIAEIRRIKDERERSRASKIAQARAILDPFRRMSRMQFASLTDEQNNRGVRLQGLVNEVEDYLDKDADYDLAGSLLYTSGVLAYYDNDIVEAKAYLDRAAQVRAPGHEGELATNEGYLLRFSFIHYFRALIQKNWGDLSEAQHEIKQSAKLLDKRPGEFLTPVTMAEILSYMKGEEDHCRTELSALINSIATLEGSLKAEGKALDANQAKLRNRMLVLYGNCFFVQGEFEKALEYYNRVLEIGRGDYYALSSAAQCELKLHRPESAVQLFRQCLEAIEGSGDIRRKRERITRAVLTVIAAMSAAGCGEAMSYERYAREARELLSGNLAVDGLSPWFFSPTQKRLVDAAQLLAEVAAISSSSVGRSS